MASAGRRKETDVNSVAQRRRAATARAIAAAALLREAEEARPAGKAQFLEQLAFLNLTRAAELIEPRFDTEEAPDAAGSLVVN